MVKEVDFDQRRDLLAAFMKPVGLFYDIHAEAPVYNEDAYVQELKGIPVLEMSGGVDFEVAVEACIRFLNSHK